MPRHASIGTPNAAHGSGYRPEIDGLRALAVLPVLFFHAGFTQWFGGGFVGVDVFFVISGYLITSILLGEMKSGKFSILRFYERRARRILPALFLVLFACLPLAWFTMWPGDMLQFARSLNMVVIFLSNHFFFHHSDYFDTAAEFKPLLHTWSLAVEEQYYFLFPPLLLLITRYAKNALPYILAAFCVVSLAFAHYWVHVVPGSAYFLLPSRFWELMIGSLLAYRHQTHAPRNHGPLSLLGLVMIAYSIVSFSPSTPYPSLYTLLPTLGAALIILYAQPGTIVSTLLSTRAMVGIGLISYSTYLWHQPLFAFARLRGMAEDGSGFFLGLIALSLLLAALTWRFVETPFRDRTLVSRRVIFTLAVAGIAFFLAVGFSIASVRGKVRLLSPAQEELLAYKKYNLSWWRTGTCFLSDTGSPLPFAADCASPRSSMVLWGDSYAASFAGGLRRLVPDLSQLSASGCAPLMGYAVHDHPYCQEINQAVWNELLRVKPRILLLQANWMFYQLDRPEIHLAETLQALHHALPSTRVYVIGNLPQWSPTLPDVMLRNATPLKSGVTLHNFGLTKLRAADDDLRRATDANGGTFISAVDYFCPKEDQCMVTAEENGTVELMSWDYGHPTLTGATWLARQLRLHELKGVK